MNPKSNVATQLLQRYPQKIDVLGFNGWHILHYACQNGHLELLNYIFENPTFDVDFNVVSLRGWTPLHSACRFGQYEVVKFLFKNHKDKGIDVTRKTNDHQTAEDLARQNGHENILEVLKIWSLPTHLKIVKELQKKHFSNNDSKGKYFGIIDKMEFPSLVGAFIINEIVEYLLGQ